MSAKQYVIMARSDSSSNGLAPLGTRSGLVSSLQAFNTGPESSDATDVLYGPGIRIELPPEEDPVRQLLLTVVEEEIAWQVIIRLAKSFQWSIVDTLSGRVLNP